MKLWGGRFSKATDGLVDDFHSSISFDQRLAEQDITGSIAHATMLGEQGIIPQADADKIVEGLRGILADVKAGKVHWMVDAEDIHMNVEALLTERIGEAGKRLHTGRSRNDQVALDCRMYAKLACQETQEMLRELLSVLLDIAQDNLHTIMPGYTHLQKAQPITLAHHLCAYAEMFRRDILRFEAAYDAPDKPARKIPSLPGLVTVLDRKRESEQKGENGVGLAGKQEKKDLLELLVGRFHHWGRSHGIGIIDEMFKKMQQHDRHYGKAAQSVHHVNAFVAGGIYGRHDNNTCQETFFFQQMEHILRQFHLPLKPRRVFSLHITEN